MQGPLILDRYRPLETAGKGGSATVEICYDTRIQRRVAIKRIPFPLCSNGTVPGLSEARTGAMLRHPNIVTVIDFEATGQEAYLIMEAMDGPSAAELIDTTPPGELDLDIIASLLSSVAEALDYAHENQVLHLDIKPDNILIERSGRTKVSDFGISELADAQGFGQACGGTIGYMPPEQMRGEDLDQRTDEFALAVTAYEMLTGTNPFMADSLEESMRRIESFQARPPSSSRQDIDSSVDDILLSAMNPQRDERFETVLEFSDELVAMLGNPKVGEKKLRDLLEGDCPPEDTEEEDSESEQRKSDLWGRVNPSVRFVASRTVCAVLCWWLGATGFVLSDLTSTEYSFALALVVAVAGAVWPGLGALAAVTVLGAAIVVNPMVPVPLGVILIAVAIAWWIVAGRKGSAAANSLLATAPLGLVHLTPLAPLAAGFTLDACEAAITAIAQVALAISLAICASSDSLLTWGLSVVHPVIGNAADLQLLSSGGTWIYVFGWVLSAIFMSALCSRQSRVLSIVGAFVSCVVLLGAYALGALLDGGIWAVPSFDVLVPVLGATVVIIVIGALGAPYREGED